MRIAPQMMKREVRLILMIALMTVKYVRAIAIIIMRIDDLYGRWLNWTGKNL